MLNSYMARLKLLLVLVTLILIICLICKFFFFSSLVHIKRNLLKYEKGAKALIDVKTLL